MDRYNDGPTTGKSVTDRQTHTVTLAFALVGG